MMKKFFSLAAIAAVVASMSLTACGPSSPEDYAEKLVELAKEAEQAEKDGDTAKVEELKKEAEELNKEIEAKCKEDKDFEKEYQAACLKLVAEEIAK